MRRALRFCLGILLASAVISGCAGQSQESAAGAPVASINPEQPAKASASLPASAGSPVTLASENIEKAVPTPRKIIYTAEVDLVSDDITGANHRLSQAVQAHHGYVASREVSGNQGEQRHAVWKLRVPVEEFDRFLAEVQQLGEVQRVHSDSQDVSDQYYDLAARLSNKRVEEQRLLAHLKSTTGRLTDILLVEKEVSRVRGEIEEMQGKLQLMQNETAFTTLTVTISEAKTYTPATSASFGTEAHRTLSDSLGTLVAVARGGTLAVIAIVPWFAVFAIVGVPVFLIVQRRRRRPVEFR